MNKLVWAIRAAPRHQDDCIAKGSVQISGSVMVSCTTLNGKALITPHAAQGVKQSVCPSVVVVGGGGGGGGGGMKITRF